MVNQPPLDARRSVDGVAMDTANRMAAISTGEIVAASLEVARAIGRQTRGDRYKGAAIALERLQDKGLVTEGERGQMEVLLDAIRETAGKRGVPGAVSRRVRDVHLTLLADPRSSVTALAIASGVNSLMAPRADDGEDDTPQVVYLTTKEGVGIGGFIGGAVGGLLGVLGGGGVFAGAAFGFSIGAVVGACFSDEDD